MPDNKTFAPLYTLPLEDLFSRAWKQMQPRLKREGECLLWQGAKEPKGCGMKIISNGKVIPTHHIAWAVAYGQYRLNADHMVLRHSCGNRHCCNVEHLYLDRRANLTRIIGLRGGKQRSHRLPCHLVMTLYTSHHSVEELCLEFDVGRSVIGDIRSGKTYRKWTASLPKIKRKPGPRCK